MSVKKSTFICILLLLFTDIVVANISNVSVPILGITSSSVVLIWDDTFVPDYTKPDEYDTTRMYYIYQDGKMIGYTKKRTFPVYGLSPETTYTFSVQLSKEIIEKTYERESITITTKKAGKIFDVKKYGAKGDGKVDDTKAIQKAIKKCSKDGTVLLTKGTYIVKHIELKSDMTLELQEGALLKFAGYDKNWECPEVKGQLEGVNGIIDYKMSGLISGYDIHNLIITGKGIIDGNGETYWPHIKEGIERPRLLVLAKGSNILVQGITMQDPPSWNNHLIYIDNALYSDVKFLKVSTVHGSNGDGLDPDASRNIMIVGCLFGNQDDSIAIKSGKTDKEGKNRFRSSEYITIRDCIFNGNVAPGSNPLGIGIGSENCGGVRHVVVQNCVFENAASIMNIKTNRNRPYAIVEDVHIENISYINNKFPDEPWNRAPISFDMFYFGKWAHPDSVVALNKTTPLFRDIHFKNIHIENPKGRFIFMRGMPEQAILDVTFENMTGISKDGVYCKDVDGVTLINVNHTAAEGEAFKMEQVKKINQFPDKEAMKNDAVYIPYQSSQDTTLTLYANFIKPDKPTPILVWMHGWHGMAKRRTYDDVHSDFTKDWFVIEPDMRGRADSDGKQDCNGWELQDVIDAVEYAKKTFPALIKSPESIHLRGGSGGGGNVLGLIGKFPDYFCEAVAEFVISDYAMWYRADSIKGEFRDEMETKGWIGGSPKTNPEAYASRGGLTTLENLNTPLALIHGDNDRRVQVEQSRAYMTKAKQIGKDNFIQYLELSGVGAFKGGAHWEGATEEQQKRTAEFTINHQQTFTKPVKISRQGKMVVAGYLKTKNFEVILDSIDHIGEVTYNLDKNEFTVTSNSAKTAILNIKRKGKWISEKINIHN